MMKMEVAPVLVIAWFVAIVQAFKCCGMGVPNNDKPLPLLRRGGSAVAMVAFGLM